MARDVSKITRLRKRKRGTKGLTQDALQDEQEEERYKPISLKMTRSILKWLQPFKWYYIAGISMGLLLVALQLTGPKFIGHLIDYTRAYATGQLQVTLQQAIWHVALVVGVLWVGLSFVTIMLDRFRILIMTYAGESVQFTLRRLIFAKLQQLSMSYYDRTKLGRIISRCTSDIGSVREVNVWGIDAIVLNVIKMVGASVAMATLTDFKLFLAVAWLGPVIYVTNRFFLTRLGLGWQMVREGYTRLSSNLAENIMGVRVVTAFNRQDPNLDEFNRLQVINTDNNVQVSRINGLYMPVLTVIGFIGRMVILLYGGYLVIATDTVTTGGLVAAWIYWDMFMGPTQELGRWYNLYMQAMAGGERLLQLLGTQPEVADVPQAKDLPPIQGRVQFEDVTFGYDPEKLVLHDVSFDALPGQMIALVGATGSGKSSIISLISRFYQPQHGRVLVDGHDIRFVTGDSLHKQMGLVLQVNYLFDGTVLDNIRYATPDATEQQVLEAARTLGTYDIVQSLKNGLHTEVGERGANMSLGQRQLICFTRAYLANPRIFMLDEATSAVDTATEMIVQRSLEKLLEGRTTFVVAHRLSTIMRADQILVIDAGRIIERGTHEQLISAGGRYAHLYEQFASAAS